jgi:hypothetical protein
MKTQYEENEDTEMWRRIKEERQLKHQNWKKTNMDLLYKSGISFKISSQECISFRNVGFPKVDFYPSTGRWRNLETGMTFNGMATGFISWYKKQGVKK